MGHPQSIWINKKKYGNVKYSGHYRRDENDEREFILMRKRRNGTYHIVSCESHEMALDAGWKHIPKTPAVKKAAAKKTHKRQGARRKK